MIDISDVKAYRLLTFDLSSHFTSYFLINTPVSQSLEELNLRSSVCKFNEYIFPNGVGVKLAD